MIVKFKRCIVRVSGDVVMGYDAFDNLAEDFIKLQAHRHGYWLEYKDVRIKRL